MATLMAILIGILLWLISNNSPQIIKHESEQSVMLKKPDKNIIILPKETPNIQDPTLRTLIDRTAKNRVTSNMSSKYQKVKHKGDLEALSYVLRDVRDSDTVRHEVANLLRRSQYGDLTKDLLAVLKNPMEKPRFRNFVVQHLYLNYEMADPDESDIIVHTLVTCLEDRDTVVRREALLALYRVGNPLAASTAKKWLKDAEKNDVHDVAIRIMREQGNRSAIENIRARLDTPKNEVVCIAAIVTLGEWQDEKSMERLTALKKTGSVRIQRACDLALRRISGEK